MLKGQPAGSAVQVVIQTFPAPAHPTDGPGRIAKDQGMVRDVPGNHGTRADKGVAPDGHPADKGRIGSDGRPPAGRGWDGPDSFCGFQSGGCKHWSRPWTDRKNIILQGHACIDADVVSRCAIGC